MQVSSEHKKTGIEYPNKKSLFRKSKILLFAFLFDCTNSFIDSLNSICCYRGLLFNYLSLVFFLFCLHFVRVSFHFNINTKNMISSSPLNINFDFDCDYKFLFVWWNCFQYTFGWLVIIMNNRIKEQLVKTFVTLTMIFHFFGSFAVFCFQSDIRRFGFIFDWDYQVLISLFDKESNTLVH